MQGNRELRRREGGTCRQSRRFVHRKFVKAVEAAAQRCKQQDEGKRQTAKPMPNPASSAAGSSRRQDRLLEILGVINDSGGLAVADLAVRMAASPATIRRDIAALDKLELVERTRGGVRSTARGELVPLELRATLRGAQKRAIAAEAAARVPSGPVAIALAGGSTVTEVLHCLEHRFDLTIVTTSVTIALDAAERIAPFKLRCML